MRHIKIKINCGAEYCEKCKYLHKIRDEYCCVQDSFSLRKGWHRNLRQSGKMAKRCRQCIDSEVSENE